MQPQAIPLKTHTTGKPHVFSGKATKTACCSDYVLSQSVLCSRTLLDSSLRGLSPLSSDISIITSHCRSPQVLLLNAYKIRIYVGYSTAKHNRKCMPADLRFRSSHLASPLFERSRCPARLRSSFTIVVGSMRQPAHCLSNEAQCHRASCPLDNSDSQHACLLLPLLRKIYAI